MALILVRTDLRGQSNLPFAIPGNPTGDKATEFIQSVAYVRAMEMTLDRIEERFPSLSVEVLAAESSWGYSPFARGANSIIQDIRQNAGEAGEKLLRSLDDQSRAVIETFAAINSVREARQFIQLVDRRAKGGIEDPQVRASLLWNCPLYKGHEEDEVRDGYVVKEVTKTAGLEVSIEWPMSWKVKASRNKDIVQKRTSHGGHGFITAVLQVNSVPVPPGVTLEENDLYEDFTQESAEEMLTQADMSAKLISFKKTKLNGRPVLWTTSKQEVEQLNTKLLMLSQCLYFFHHDKQVLFQFLVPAANEADTDSRIKRYEPLFLAIARSLHLESVDPKQDKPIESSPLPSLSGGSSSVDYENFTCAEFRFIARLPKNVLETRAKHVHGVIGTFKALDAARMSTVGVTVNKIDTFVRAVQRGDTGWEEDALNSNFKSYINSYPGIASDSVQSAKVEWLGCPAIEFNFSCVGNVGDGVHSFHSGLLFLERGSFFNLNVTSLTSIRESKDSLAELKKGFAVLDVK